MVEEPKIFSSFRDRLYHLQVIPSHFRQLKAYLFDISDILLISSDSREQRTIGCALVDLAYMDGGFLHVETFKKEKWYRAI